MKYQKMNDMNFKLHLRTYLVLVLFACTAASYAQNKSDIFDIEASSLSPGLNEIHVDFDGHSRRFLITTPQTFDDQKVYTVLFCFHGAGGKADGMNKRWSPQADERDIIVISAEAIQPMSKWNFKDKFHAEDHDDVGLVSKMVNTLIAKKIADPKAIYSTGHSSGGLFSYRLARETDLFAALAPMSCGMAKGAHDPDQNTNQVSILQVIGDQDKSYSGSTNAKVTMYSAKERIEIWRKFNECSSEPSVKNLNEKVTIYTYSNPAGIEVVLIDVKGEEHHLERGLRDMADVAALDFLLSHRKK